MTPRLSFSIGNTLQFLSTLIHGVLTDISCIFSNYVIRPWNTQKHYFFQTQKKSKSNKTLQNKTQCRKETTITGIQQVTKEKIK